MLVEIDVDKFCQLGFGWAWPLVADLGEMLEIVVQDVVDMNSSRNP